MKVLFIIAMIVCNDCYGQLTLSTNGTITHRAIFFGDEERKKDTILVFANVTDTTHEFIEPLFTDSVSFNNDSTEIVYWVNGKKANPIDLDIPTEAKTYGTYLYSVRELHNTAEGVIDPYFCINCKYVDYYKHLYYIDINKQKLSPNIVVWQSIEVK